MLETKVNALVIHEETDVVRIISAFSHRIHWAQVNIKKRQTSLHIVHHQNLQRLNCMGRCYHFESFCQYRVPKNVLQTIEVCKLQKKNMVTPILKREQFLVSHIQAPKNVDRTGADEEPAPHV